MISVYYTDISGVPADRDGDAFSLLTEARQAVSWRIRQPQARRVSVYAGLLLQCALSTHGVSSDGILWDGKPHFADKRIHFNLSHSGTGIAAAVSDLPCGIDLEAPHPVRNAASMRKRLFSKTENEAFPATDGFFRLWTAKEAYQKYTGCGFSLPMSEIRISSFDGISGTAESSAHGTVFLHWIPMDSHILCVCLSKQAEISVSRIPADVLLSLSDEIREDIK